MNSHQGEMRYSPPEEIYKIQLTDWSKVGPKRVIETLQMLGERAMSIALNDRHPHRAADAQFLKEVFCQVAIDARSRWQP